MRTSATIVVAAPPIEVEQLWYDRSRWASWIDGFAHLTRLDDEWPQEGARRVWSSPPGGRGLVMETVKAYRAGEGFASRVEDVRLAGLERVLFAPVSDGTRITLEFEFEPKGSTPPARRWWMKRKLGESLQRTLTRFSYEVAAETHG